MVAASAVIKESSSLVQVTAITQREGVLKINRKFSTRKLVYLAFLIALTIVLTRMLSLRIAIGGVEGIRIGFGDLPIILAGIAFGPLAGGIVGALSDVLGFLISPMGAYMPHFTLTTFLTGFIPGMLSVYVLKDCQKFWSLLIAVMIGQVISDLILVPIFLNNLFGIPFQAAIIPRIIGQVIHIPIFAYLVKILLGYQLFGDEVKTVCDH